MVPSSSRGARRGRPRGALRTLALVGAALLAEGCVTGHLVDAGRRNEELLRVRSAWLDGPRLVLDYTAAVSTESGERVATRERQAVVDLATLSPARVPRVDSVLVAWPEEDGASGVPERGRRLPVRAAEPHGEGAALSAAARLATALDGAPPAHAERNGNGANGHAPPTVLPAVATGPPALWVFPSEDGRHAALLLRAEGAAAPGYPLSTRSFARGSTAPWVWALAPFTLVFDAITVPLFPIFAYPLVTMGD